jgi:hypothetical protein
MRVIGAPKRGEYLSSPDAECKGVKISPEIFYSGALARSGSVFHLFEVAAPVFRVVMDATDAFEVRASDPMRLELSRLPSRRPCL